MQQGECCPRQQACCKAFGLARVSCLCSVSTKCLEGGVSCCVVRASTPAACPFVMGKMTAVCLECSVCLRGDEKGSGDVKPRCREEGLSLQCRLCCSSLLLCPLRCPCWSRDLTNRGGFFLSQCVLISKSCTISAAPLIPQQLSFTGSG